jgi:hypothetical protein
MLKVAVFALDIQSPNAYYVFLAESLKCNYAKNSLSRLQAKIADLHLLFISQTPLSTRFQVRTVSSSVMSDSPSI